MALTIRPAQFPQDNNLILTLFAAYAESLGIDLSFQDFDAELASFPGKYASSESGSLLVAEIHPNPTDPTNRNGNVDIPNQIIGCVALRRNTPSWCEMKRLYVIPQARKSGAGVKLIEAIIGQARKLGYEGMRLDTLPEMAAAQKLYRRFGFEEVERYYETPVDGTVFMGLRL